MKMRRIGSVRWNYRRNLLSSIEKNHNHSRRCQMLKEKYIAYKIKKTRTRKKVSNFTSTASLKRQLEPSTSFKKSEKAVDPGNQVIRSKLIHMRLNLSLIQKIVSEVIKLAMIVYHPFCVNDSIRAIIINR